MKIELKRDDVLAALEKLAPATVSDIAKYLDVNQMYISGYLSALEDQKFIMSKQAGSSVIYMKR